jgi:hypothetical protein
MAYNQKQLKTDAYGKPVPQVYNPTKDDYEVAQGSDGAMHVKMFGNMVVEQKTHTNASSGTVTFANNIAVLEIYNVDATNTGVFNINGIDITVPAGKVFKASFGGTPRATVTVTGSTNYILTRYE